MLVHFMGSKLMMGPHLADMVLVFFAYSLMGFALECVVLSIQHRQLVTDRGFVVHLPFCIIYGFGGLIGYAFLHPFRENFILLFAAGAVSASIFEYMVARLQIRLFGDFWWDYNDKPFNYKGILCLESTLGWGLAAIVIIMVLHSIVVGTVGMLPRVFRAPLASALTLAYFADFIYSVREAKRSKSGEEIEDAFINQNEIKAEVNEWNLP